MAYEKDRPHMPAEVRRQVMTESGHQCAVQHCGEHIVEVHHIDENRENNVPSNLIVLCDKHHKLAHSGVISRMDQRKYKELLIQRPISAPTYQRSDHDKKLLNTISDIFPYETIEMLRNESFGKFVRKEIIDPIFDFNYRSSDPLFKFTDPTLESIRSLAVNQAQAFIRHFSQQSAGLITGYEYIDLNEIRMRNPNADIPYWIKYSEDTRVLAYNFCETLLKLRAELVHQ